VRIVLDSEFHRPRKENDRDLRMSQLVGSPIAQDHAGATDLLVNVFDGGPRTRVLYQIGVEWGATLNRAGKLDLTRERYLPVLVVNTKVLLFASLGARA